MPHIIIIPIHPIVPATSVIDIPDRSSNFTGEAHLICTHSTQSTNSQVYMYAQDHEFAYAGVCTVPSSNLPIPVVIILVVMVLLLITCVALLVLALAVTATKLNKLRAEKGHTDPPHYYDQIREGERRPQEETYEEMEEEAGLTQGQMGLYQELELDKMEERVYEGLTKKNTSAKAKRGQ